jgi:hypothetical protein
MQSRNFSWIIFAVTVLWITGVMLAFFEFAPRGLGGIAWNELGLIASLLLKHVVRHYVILILIMLSSWVVGMRLCAAMRLDFAGALEQIVVATSLGIVIHSMAVMLLGFIHLLYPPVLLLLIIVPIIIWRNTLAAGWHRAAVAWRQSRISGVQLVLLILLLLCVLFTSLTPLYPPTSLDAVNAYLSIPKAYLNAGWLVLDPYIKYSMAPNNHTFLFTSAMGLGDGISSVLTHWGVWCLLLAALAAFGTRYLSPTGGLCAAVAFALVPVTTVTATWGNAENFAALYAFMGFWGMWRFAHSRAAGDAILTGLFLGFAFGVKIFLGMLWLGVLILGAIYLISSKGGFPLKRFALIVLVSIAMVSPWFIRNIVYFGNPFFPYFNERFERFGGIYQGYEGDIKSDIGAGLKGFSPEMNDVTLRNLAREITFWPSWGSKPHKPGQMRFTERKYLGIGPLFIALLPLLLLVRRKWDVLAGLLVISALCILTWFYGIKIIYIRYWSFFFPFLMAAGGFAFAEALNLDARSVRKPFGLALVSIISALVILYFLNGVMPTPGGGHLPLKEVNRRAHLVKNVLGYKLIEQLNEMEPEPRVYFLYGATARYYCDFFIIAGYTTPYNYDRFWEHATDGEELYRWLREIGITHLLVNRARPSSPRKRLPNDDAFRENFIHRQSEVGVVMYELRQ